VDVQRKLFSVALDLVDIAQDYYAERLGKVYVVGANWFYFLLWKVVSPFLSDRTKAKVTLLDSPEDILEYIDESQLHEGWFDPVL